MMETMDPEEFGRQLDQLEVQHNMTDRPPPQEAQPVVTNQAPRHQPVNNVNNLGHAADTQQRGT